MTAVTALRAAFATQARWCERLDSPLTARLCLALGATIDGSTETGRRLLDWPDPSRYEADAVALRVTGGLHALVRRGRLPMLAVLYPPAPLPELDRLAQVVEAAIRDADAELAPWLDRTPQTNEVGRSGVLMPGLLVTAAATELPLAIYELGASAGLNLRLDAYAYRLGGVNFGSAGAPLTIAPAWEGPPPPAAALHVVRRRGVDRAPLDVTDAADRERLIAYIWPDQADRLDRVVRAVAAAALDPPAIDHMGGADWVERMIDTAPEPGVARVLFHSIALQYLPDEDRERIALHMARAGRQATDRAPLAWLRYELDPPTSDRATLRLRLWPRGHDRLLAQAHPHGRWLRWLA